MVTWRSPFLSCRFKTTSFIFFAQRDNFIQLSPDYSQLSQCLQSGTLAAAPAPSYPTVSPFISNNSSISSFLISNVNSIPQMNIQVQNMPILPSSNISKPQLQSLIQSSSSEKSRSTLLDSFRNNTVGEHCSKQKHPKIVMLHRNSRLRSPLSCNFFKTLI